MGGSGRRDVVRDVAAEYPRRDRRFARRQLLILWFGLMRRDLVMFLSHHHVVSPHLLMVSQHLILNGENQSYVLNAVMRGKREERND